VLMGRPGGKIATVYFLFFAKIAYKYVRNI
jgi:hypothetical protein